MREHALCVRARACVSRGGSFDLKAPSCCHWAINYIFDFYDPACQILLKIVQLITNVYELLFVKLWMKGQLNKANSKQNKTGYVPQPWNQACTKIWLSELQNHTNKYLNLKVPFFVQVRQCCCAAGEQATQLTLGERTDHWLDHSLCGIEVFCQVLTRTSSLRPRASLCVRACVGLRRCIWSSDLCFVMHGFLPATPWLPQALSCDPIHFDPGLTLAPSLRPSYSSRPASPSPSSLSFFCVSTDVWNYSGMEGWIPPWWAEWRREPFVQ